MKRETNTESLKAVIDRFLKKYQLDGKYTEQRIAAIWNDMLGHVIASKTSSIDLRKNGVLVVKLESAVIRNELSFAQDKIIEDINKALGSKAVQSLELR